MNKVPAKISQFKKGQKVYIGKDESFGIRGVIHEIVKQDPFPIKVNVNLTTVFELSLEEYNKSWKLDK